MILTFWLSPKARVLAFENKNVIAAELHQEGDTVGTRFIVDGAEKFYPNINFWDLDGFVKGVLSV